MKPTYPTGQPVNLFDSVLAQTGDADQPPNPGIVIGFPSDNHATVAFVGARYCESDGRKEATDLGQSATFFRGDQGILCVELTELTLDVKRLTLVAASGNDTWGGSPLKRGVIDAPSMAICSPEPLRKSASTSGAPGGSVSA